MNATERKTPRLRGDNRLFTGLLIVFIVTASITAYLAFVTVRDAVASWSSTGGLPGNPVLVTSTPVVNEQGTPQPVATQQVIQPIAGPQAKEWDGASRVNILVMGLDYRDWQAGDGPPRSDTMILFTIDPRTQTAGMLSIPRDLWVNIPGFEYSKINNAYQLGEAYRLPEGGPGLAMKTVEQVIGVPVDYYAVIDFNAFVRFIDEIDGVKIDVPERILVDIVGRGEHSKVWIKPGVQVLPGDLALAYARARYTEGGDFDRAQRQQQIILGVRDRILEFNMIPKLLPKAPTLYQELSSGVTTNLTLDQMIKLGILVSKISPENIHHAVIGLEQVNIGVSPDGLDILKPVPDQIRILRDQVFAAPTVNNPVLENKSDQELMQAEAANLALYNGTYTSGLAANTSDYLQSLGATVIQTGNAPQLYNYTTIIDYTGKPYTVAYLVNLMHINPNRIYNRYDPESQVDVEIFLGDDWVQNNSMP